MGSRHRDLLYGTFGRVTSATFDFFPSHDSVRPESLRLGRNRPSPPSDSSGTASPPSVYATLARNPTKHSMLAQGTARSHKPAQSSGPPSLSVYERPTGTFMWPRFSPSAADVPSLNQMMYVKYKPRSDDGHVSVPTSAEGSPRSEGFDATPRSTPASTPPPTTNRKRGSSSESNDLLASPSDRFLKHPRTSRDHPAAHRVSSDRSTIPSASSEAPGLLLRPVESDLPRTFRTLDIVSDGSDVEWRNQATHNAAHHSNSGHPTNVPRSAAPADVNAYAARAASGDLDENEWKKYAIDHVGDNGESGMKCTWQLKISENQTKECPYHAKKHLVKRHIFAKHLKRRPWVCTFCEKGFAQKSNLETHLNTHTGRKPHKCHYCNIRFKDPARRQRHMAAEHGHVGSRTKKGRVAACNNAPSPSTPGSDA